MKEITPAHLKCGVGLCPAVFRLDDGQIAVIGKAASSDGALPQEIQLKVSKEEAVVIIPAEYLMELDL